LLSENFLKAISLAMGGRIEAESTVGKGTTFNLYLKMEGK
jgi:signal transduction histidine kinase